MANISKQQTSVLVAASVVGMTVASIVNQQLPQHPVWLRMGAAVALASSIALVFGFLWYKFSNASWHKFWYPQPFRKS